MMKRLAIVLMVIGISGCMGTAPGVLLRQYVLEYPPPAALGTPASGEILKVATFAADRLYASGAMLYRQDPYRREAYRERRWRIQPAEMVTDFLRRDLQHAGLFRAVLPLRDPAAGRYVLEGWVEEFLEADEGQNRKALLVATAALLDSEARDSTKRVLFQKTYRCEALYIHRGGEGMAEAMSRAMSQFSTQLIADIAAALKQTGR